MTEEVLIFLSLIIGVVALVTILAKAIKQPPIVAYLISGIILGPLLLGLLDASASQSELIQILAKIGIAFLLFIVGLSLDFRVLKDVGKVSIFTGLGQIIITASIILLISLGLKFNLLTAIYLGVAFAFSSTVVVVKILSEKKEMETLHGRISLGILIVQDIVAALALMIIPSIESLQLSTILIQLGRTTLLILAIFIFSTLVLKRYLYHIAKNQEVLFIFGVAWALVIATLFDQLGLSLEIGALIAGMALASSEYTLELGGKMKPLRDFFIVLFFVYFGSLLTGPVNLGIISKSIIFSAIIFIGNPIIIMSLMKASGYKKRTNFLTGFSVAQISEFSLILLLLGFNSGHIPQETISIGILTALITIGLSSYSIYYSNKVYNKLSRFIGIFEGKIKKEKEVHRREKPFDIVVFGSHRIGYSIVRTLKKLKMNFIVVDYNPAIIRRLEKENIKAVYGDANDKEFIDELKLVKVKMIISTIPEIESNLTILERLEEIGSEAIFIPTAQHSADALDFYKKGADYVIMPFHLGGEYTSNLIKENLLDYKNYKKISKKHIEELKKMQERKKTLALTCF